MVKLNIKISFGIGKTYSFRISNKHSIIATLKDYKNINRAEMHCNHIDTAVGPARVFLHGMPKKGTASISLQLRGLNNAILAKSQIISGNTLVLLLQKF